MFRSQIDKLTDQTERLLKRLNVFVVLVSVAVRYQADGRQKQ